MKRITLLLAIFFLLSFFVFSADFGLLLDQRLEAENGLSGNRLITYTPALAPWFSWNGGEGVSVYLSGLFSYRYYNYNGDISGDGWTFVPELSRLVKDGGIFIPEISRFAINYRINEGMTLEAGRVAYDDALGFVASGLFDGVILETEAPLGTITAGIFYTGLLYKETGKIIMTDYDAKKYSEEWDYDFSTGYFTSRRALAAVRWDMPVGESNSLSAELLAQFDLNGEDEKLNSQYLEVLYEFYPEISPMFSMMRVSVGALVETMQNNDGDFGAAFGFLAKVKTDLPTSISDWLGLTVKFTSGASGDIFNSFIPLSSVSQGMIFANTNAGLALVSADYSLMITESLFAECSFSYYIRTYDDPYIDGRLYGGEVWASLGWQPLEDIRATLGGGVFFPGMGNIYPDNSDAMWKITAGVTLSF